MKETDKARYFEMSREFYSLGVTNSQISDSGRESFWKEIMRGEIVKGYILRCNAEAAGYAVCALSASQEACGRVLWLDELFVKPQFRGKGVAKEFFRFIENSDEYRSEERRVGKECYRAMKLYKSLGYKDAQYISLYKKTNKSDLEKE